MNPDFLPDKKITAEAAGIIKIESETDPVINTSKKSDVAHKFSAFLELAKSSDFDIEYDYKKERSKLK